MIHKKHRGPRRVKTTLEKRTRRTTVVLSLITKQQEVKAMVVAKGEIENNRIELIV